MAASCVLLLGANLGDRRKNLREALAGLARLPGSRLGTRSKVYETAPVGPSHRPYLNLAVEFRTSLTPMGLLVELKRLEALAGRRPGRRWGARALDIDILRYGVLRLKSPWLSLPHPRILERAFVLAPLCELCPAWKPDGRTTVAARRRRLNPGPGTVKIYSNGL
ncbi:MAG: 2-amino-4-hydroxy-6-hydroxymethyldihydropteridine diphosphokinase [Elusimicrobia bacterium]|nr:2-amino-4-hydroxy-6-hydroxymethyldihydropteridine diphosphokinase [Elusimicrobiota bacterium]